MYRLIRFFKRYYPVLLFIVLEFLAVNHYAGSSSYANARILTVSNSMAGGVHKVFSGIGDWFSMGRENRRLMEHMAELEAQLESCRTAAGLCDSISLPGNEYFYSTARIINNTVNRKENFFLLDKGTEDGVERNMSVTAPDGTVAGYVQEASRKFAVCMSVLNRDFRIGGKVKGREYIGSVFWDGMDSDFVTLADIPKYAKLEVGDTVVSAYSSRFPPDLPIGTISSLGDSPDGTTYWIKVRLGTKIAGLSNVMLIKYSDSQELQSLEEQYFNGGQNR